MEAEITIGNRTYRKDNNGWKRVKSDGTYDNVSDIFEAQLDKELSMQTKQRDVKKLDMDGDLSTGPRQASAPTNNFANKRRVVGVTVDGENSREHFSLRKLGSMMWRYSGHLEGMDEASYKRRLKTILRRKGNDVKFYRSGDDIAVDRDTALQLLDIISIPLVSKHLNLEAKILREECEATFLSPDTTTYITRASFLEYLHANNISTIRQGHTTSLIGLNLDAIWESVNLRTGIFDSRDCYWDYVIDVIEGIAEPTVTNLGIVLHVLYKYDDTVKDVFHKYDIAILKMDESDKQRFIHNISMAMVHQKYIENLPQILSEYKEILNDYACEFED